MHTVEKIGGTSMSRFEEVLDNIFIGRREGAALYQRIFVVSAYSGMANLLLEHKKTGEPGVYQRFADAQSEGAWREALEGVRQRMLAKNCTPPTSSSTRASTMPASACTACRSFAPTATSSSPNT